MRTRLATLYAADGVAPDPRGVRQLLLAEGPQRCARPFAAEDGQLLKYWLSGWAVPDLPTVGEFVEVAREAGLSDIRIEDATAEAWPSLARMHLRALVGYPSAKALRSIGLCTDAHLAGVRAGLEQFEALGRGLWVYAIFTATKGSQDAGASYRGR